MTWYTMLTDLEAVFRSLKSELGMRPVYHQKTHRVESIACAMIMHFRQVNISMQKSDSRYLKNCKFKVLYYSNSMGYKPSNIGNKVPIS